MKIAAVGDNCMDVYPDGRAFPGGNPVNVAVYARRLGVSSSYTGAVGDDPYGRRLLEALSEKGVDTSHVRVLEGATAVTRVTLEHGDRVLGEYDEGVLARFKLSPQDIAFLAGHDLVVTGLWGKVEGDLPAIRRGGARVAFDFADRLEDPILDTALPCTDYAFFSCDSGDSPALRSRLKAFHACGPRLAVATMGARGSLAWDGTRFTACGIVPCPVVDTMGAGDSYIAGFLCGLLEGLPLEACMNRGAQSSAVTIGYFGAW